MKIIPKRLSELEKEIIEDVHPQLSVIKPDDSECEAVLMRFKGTEAYQWHHISPAGDYVPWGDPIIMDVVPEIHP